MSSLVYQFVTCSNNRFSMVSLRLHRMEYSGVHSSSTEKIPQSKIVFLQPKTHLIDYDGLVLLYFRISSA